MSQSLIHLKQIAHTLQLQNINPHVHIEGITLKQSISAKSEA